MPHDIRIIRSRDFVRLDAEGRFDVAQTRHLFSDVIWACVNSRIGCVLLDIRESVSDMTVAQVSSLASVCREVTPLGSYKIAILTAPQMQFDRARTLATAAGKEGWNIEAFHDFEAAFEWLIS